MHILQSLFFSFTRTGLVSQSERYTSLMKLTSNNLALSLSLSLLHLFILGEMAESLLDGLGLRVEMRFIVNQFPRNSRHVSRLPCEDVPIFLEEDDEREFLFGVQVISHASNLRGLLRRQRDRLVV
jgi:hypothetical protein